MRTLLYCIIFWCVSTMSWAQLPLPNGSFEDAVDDQLEGWQLVGQGRWETGGHSGNHCISLKGSPDHESAYWRCSAEFLQPGHTYHFSFWVKSVDAAGGCVVSGPNFANRDFGYTTTWQHCEFVFMVPPQLPAEAYLRLGMWGMTGTLLFDDVVLQEVIPVDTPHGDLLLASGEQVEGRIYRFAPDFSYEGSNYSPNLVNYSCGYNSNRWPFAPGTELVYRQGLPGIIQSSGRVSLNLGYHTAGSCLVEASRDGQTWMEVGNLGQLGTATFTIPDDLFPAAEVLVRLRSPGQGQSLDEAAPGSFQVYGYEYEATIERDLGLARGTTRFIQLHKSNPDLTVQIISLGELHPGRENTARLQLRNNTTELMRLQVIAQMVMPPLSTRPPIQLITVLPKQQIETNLTYPISNLTAELRRNELWISIHADKNELFAARCPVTFSSLQMNDYGYLIQPGGDHVPTLWWCEGPYKVSLDRSAPTRRDPVVRLSAAGNEFEAVQVILQCQKPLQDFMASISGPENLNGVEWTINQVAYHHVTRPTDEAGCVGWWPDALPPLENPVNLQADQNHPLWITAYVPTSTRPGTYRARLNLNARGWQATLPLELRVYGFSLSKEPHLESGFGLSEGTIARYHNLNSLEERRQVWDLYMRNFREHRLSPYDFAPFDPFHVQLGGEADAWHGGEFDTTTPVEGEQCLKIADQSTTSAVAATHKVALSVEPGVAYRLTWHARTEKPGQQYLLTLSQYRSGGVWLMGQNLDLPYTGDGTWQNEEFIISADRLHPETVELSLSLRPVLWSEAGERTGTAWFDALSFTRMDGGPNLIHDPSFEADLTDIEVHGDFAAWDEQAKHYLDEYGFANMTLPMMSLAEMSFNREGTGRLGPYKQGSEGYERLYQQVAMTVQNHLEEKGWLRKGYVYWYDEPEPKDYPFVSAGMRLLKKGAPKIRRMLTEEPVSDLFGEVDIWCPVESNLVQALTAARQAEGETIWWYVCTGPKAPWPGLFIDHSALDLRVWLWLTVKYNVQGVLIWTTNWWTSAAAFPNQPQNPWTDPMGYVDGYGYQPGQVAYWGNGDGRMLYPPNRDINNDQRPYLKGPINSIRWEMLRDGCEDWEYFYELRQAITFAKQAGKSMALIVEAEKLLTVPNSVVDEPTNFNQDPQELLQHRQRLAEMIERLRR